MNNDVLNYLSSSFLKDLIVDPNITDISYNGEDIYYQNNLYGRKKSDINVSSKEVYDFIRHIANLTDSQFSFSSPILDISYDKYRINAIHFAIARKRREPTINFSIRIASKNLRISKENGFLNEKIDKLIELFLKAKQSIMIGGKTSSGKTELQKYILSKMKENTRIIIIDNVEELETDDFLKNIDSQIWLMKNKDVDFDDLIKNALRSNPDWLIVSEARGKEMLSILNSAMSGHPTISTIHAKSASFMFKRMGRMCMLKNENLKFKNIIEDIYDHFKLVIYVARHEDENGRIVRYIEKIGTNTINKYYELYSYPNTYYALPNEFKVELNLKDEEFKEFNEYWSKENEK